MFKINSLVIAGFLATLSVSHAFLDCSTKKLKLLEALLCQNSSTWCKEDGEIPIVFDFSEFAHRQYVYNLTIPLPGYEGKIIPVKAFGKKYPYFTPNQAGVNVLGGAPRIMDTAFPESDPDLGTPNKLFGGPGVGVAGGTTNKLYLGNAMFIQERYKAKCDDAMNGGDIKFDFSQVEHSLTITKVGLIDLDTPRETLLEDSDELILKTGVEGLGDNSFEEVDVNGAGSDMEWLNLRLAGTGALAYMKGCIARKPATL